MGRYAKEIKDFISDNVKGTTTRELVELTNKRFGTEFTEAKMKAFKNNHNLKSGTQSGLPAGYSKTYSPEVQKFIEDNIVGRSTEQLTQMINEKFGTQYIYTQIRAYIKNHKLISGLDCRFQKGNVPYNKGTNIGGWEPTQFKKGVKPHNYQPIGSERVNGEDYIDVKIADPNKWKGKHILIWEKHNGPIPKGYVVIFGDRDNRNFSIDNLLLVSRQQLLILNQHKLIQKDADLTKTGILIADVKTKISQRKRRK